jgi:UDP-N-acetylglucosamine 4-epimerase
MNRYDEIRNALSRSPKRWLITGVAGFIGSNLLERLLGLGQTVVGLDNFSTGHRHNIDEALASAGAGADARFQLIDGDICDVHLCRSAMRDVDLVLHQAALGSVPRSVEAPLNSHAANVDGFVNVLVAAREAKVQRIVYASSSSVYGDDRSETKRENVTGQPLSPYAATKVVDEVYAGVFGRVYGMELVGLRYFNVFGARQDPNGPYAAVIPRWTELLLRAKPCVLYGEGSKSRDCCYIENVVQATLLAALADRESLAQQVYNVACGKRTTLEELFVMLRERVAIYKPSAAAVELQREPPRVGDVEHSLADIDAARRLLGYAPAYDITRGLDEMVAWFVRAARRRRTTEGAELVESVAPSTS